MSEYPLFRHDVRGVTDQRVLDTLVDQAIHRRSAHNERPYFKTSEVVFAFWQRYGLRVSHSVINLRLQRLCTNGLAERSPVAQGRRKYIYWRPAIAEC